jgi:hypothetical protein
MKKILFIGMLLLAFGCKTKSVTVDKSKEKEFEAMMRSFDSLFQKSIQHQLDWQKNQSSISNNLVLTSFPELDSSGIRKPFHYKHFVDGDLKEEIWLEGGEISAKTETKQTKEGEHKQESKAENTRIEVDVGQKKESKKSKIDKAKTAEVKGFQFGFYLWSFLLIVVIIVLAWIAKKFKLLDKFKSIFNTKGG